MNNFLDYRVKRHTDAYQKEVQHVMLYATDKSLEYKILELNTALEKLKLVVFEEIFGKRDYE